MNAGGTFGDTSALEAVLLQLDQLKSWAALIVAEFDASHSHAEKMEKKIVKVR